MDGPFENLIVWQRAMELVRAVYALTDQLRRAVASIPSNIAEGYGRASNGDYAHFLAIARGSLYETMTQLRIGVDMGYIAEFDPGLKELMAEVGRMLTSMLKKYGSIHSTPRPTTYA